MALVSSRMGRWLAPLTQALAVLLPLVNTWLWLVPGWAETIARHLAALPTETVTLSEQALWLGWGITLLQLLILSAGLLAMARVFRLFANGEHLQPQVGVQVRRFGNTLLLFGASTPLFRALLVIVVTFDNPPGQRLLAFGFSSNEIVIALVGVLLVMLGYALQEAADIAEDNRQII